MEEEIINFSFFDFEDVINSVEEKDFSIIGEGGFFKFINYEYYEEMVEAMNILLNVLAEKVSNIFEKERKDDLLNGKIYKFDTEKDFVVVADLHGDREALTSILKKEDFFQSEKKFIFLGDYIDRGPYQPSVLIGVLLLKYFFPDRVFILRGNHEYFREKEGELSQSVSGDDIEVFINFWRDYFSEETIHSIHVFFETMPFLVILNSDILFVHAGIPKWETKKGEYPSIESINDLNDSDLIYQMVWSDPENKEDVYLTGGSRFSFAYKQFKNFMDKLDLDMIIRGHEVKFAGYDIPDFYNNRLLTVFSTGCNPLSRDCEREACCNCYTGYSRVKPHYVKIRNYEKLQIKSVFSDEISEEFKISELKNIWKKEKEKEQEILESLEETEEIKETELEETESSLEKEEDKSEEIEKDEESYEEEKEKNIEEREGEESSIYSENSETVEKKESEVTEKEIIEEGDNEINAEKDEEKDEEEGVKAEEDVGSETGEVGEKESKLEKKSELREDEKKSVDKEKTVKEEEKKVTENNKEAQEIKSRGYKKKQELEFNPFDIVFAINRENIDDLRKPFKNNMKNLVAEFSSLRADCWRIKIVPYTKKEDKGKNVDFDLPFISKKSSLIKQIDSISHFSDSGYFPFFKRKNNEKSMDVIEIIQSVLKDIEWENKNRFLIFILAQGVEEDKVDSERVKGISNLLKENRVTKVTRIFLLGTKNKVIDELSKLPGTNIIYLGEEKDKIKYDEVFQNLNEMILNSVENYCTNQRELKNE